MSTSNNLNKTNFEISGSHKAIKNSASDWYYGGGNMYWPSLVSALVGVPVAVRENRTIAVEINGKINEYIWYKGALADGDLKLKYNKTKYQQWLEAGNVGTEAEFDALAVTDLTDLLDGKVDKVDGKGLSTNDFDDATKIKVDNIEPGAQVNVQSDWDAIDGDALIKNKPEKFKPEDHNHTIGEVDGLVQALDGKVDDAELESHVNNVENPHGVTKDQVGLDKVDNTSDLEKPISTPTSDALATKADKTSISPVGYSNSYEDLSDKPDLELLSKKSETGAKLLATPSNATISLLDHLGNVLDTINVGFLNNEGTTLVYDDVDNNIILQNDAGETLSTIPVGAFISNIPSNINLDGVTLQLRDSTNLVLSSVGFGIQNIAGLSEALDNKADLIHNHDDKYYDKNEVDNLIQSNRDKTYIHTQSQPAGQWTIAHNLGKLPSVSIIDSAGTMVHGDVTYVDSNNIVINFNGGFTGQATLN